MFPFIAHAGYSEAQMKEYEEQIKNGKSLADVYQELMFDNIGPKDISDVSPKSEQYYNWEFIKAYPFNLNNKKDRKKLEQIYTQVMNAMQHPMLPGMTITLILGEESRTTTSSFLGLFKKESNILILKWGRCKVEQVPLIRHEEEQLDNGNKKP